MVLIRNSEALVSTGVFSVAGPSPASYAQEILWAMICSTPDANEASTIFRVPSILILELSAKFR
ncbi:hypothetical protein D3C73_1645150 [compost metagenome]